MAIDDMIAGGGRARRSDGPRRSGGKAALFWLVAIAAGGGAAFMLKLYIDSRSGGPATKVQQVVVAALDLPVATTLHADHLKAVDWPQSAVPAGSTGDAKSLVGRVLRTKLVQGEPILGSKLAAKEAGQGLAALIPSHMRAVAVRVDDVVGVAGFVHPDDRVDVIVTLKPDKPDDAEFTSKVILQNVKVLAVGQDLDTKDQRGKALAVTVATLLVTPQDSEKLALAASQGKLLLTLRSWDDETAVETPGSMPTALLTGVAAPVKAAPVVSSSPSSSSSRRSRSSRTDAPAAAPAPAKKEVVEILRGDRFEERNFDSKEKP